MPVFDDGMRIGRMGRDGVAGPAVVGRIHNHRYSAHGGHRNPHDHGITHHRITRCGDIGCACFRA